MAGISNCAQAPASSSGTVAPSRKLNPDRACNSTYRAAFAICSPTPFWQQSPSGVNMSLMHLWELADLSTPWSLFVVATLRIADRIEAGTTAIEQLAAEAGAHPESLQRVIRQLVNKGVFEEPAPGH